MAPSFQGVLDQAVQSLLVQHRCELGLLQEENRQLRVDIRRLRQATSPEPATEAEAAQKLTAPREATGPPRWPPTPLACQPGCVGGGAAEVRGESEEEIKPRWAVDCFLDLGEENPPPVTSPLSSDFSGVSGRCSLVVQPMPSLKAAERHNDAVLAAHRARLSRRLHVLWGADKHKVTVDELQHFLLRKADLERANRTEWVAELMSAFCGVNSKTNLQPRSPSHVSRRSTDSGQFPFSPARGISVKNFIDMLLLPDLEELVKSELLSTETTRSSGSRRISLARHQNDVSEGPVVLPGDVAAVQKAFFEEDLEDTIARVAAIGLPGEEDEDEAELFVDLTPRVGRLAQKALEVASSLAAVVSLLALGFSMDLAPKSSFWVVLEALCTTVWLVEFVVKVFWLERFGYFIGPNKIWNWTDTLILIVSMTDLLFFVADFSPNETFTVFLRALRSFRVVRLIKVLRLPLPKSLANMLFGLVYGAHSLLWVLFLMGVVVYCAGLTCRMMVGSSRTGLIEECGFDGDNVQKSDNPDCNEYKLYGEEYFGSMPVAMFTVFRCITFDCSTAAGKSLTVSLSREYGYLFYCGYYAGAVLVLFGIFNVITAIFVESTLNGLKFNDAQRRMVALYQSKYVKNKLRSLVMRVIQLQGPGADGELALAAKHKQGWLGNDIMLKEDGFNAVLRDKKVASLFADLDVDIANTPFSFDMFHRTSQGEVGLAQIIETLMLLRGELCKTDMVASRLTLKGLQSKLEELQSLMCESQTELLSVMAKNDKEDPSPKIQRRPSERILMALPDHHWS